MATVIKAKVLEVKTYSVTVTLADENASNDKFVKKILKGRIKGQRPDRTELKYAYHVCD